jgi:hypothetical protein
MLDAEDDQAEHVSRRAGGVHQHGIDAEKSASAPDFRTGGALMLAI